MSETDFAVGKQCGIIRTDVFCHECSKTFIAHIDYDIDGNHIVECPYCGHHHFRQINNGIVTEVRHSDQPTDRNIRTRVERGMWKHNTVPMACTTVSAFLRERWLNGYNES